MACNLSYHYRLIGMLCFSQMTIAGFHPGLLKSLDAALMLSIGPFGWEAILNWVQALPSTRQGQCLQQVSSSFPASGDAPSALDEHPKCVQQFVGTRFRQAERHGTLKTMQARKHTQHTTALWREHSFEIHQTREPLRTEGPYRTYITSSQFGHHLVQELHRHVYCSRHGLRLSFHVTTCHNLGSCEKGATERAHVLLRWYW